MMDREARRFRRDCARHLGERTGTAIRYSHALRRRAVAWAKRRHEAGAAVAAIARELGLRPRTLRLWLREPTRKPCLRRLALDLAPGLPAPLPGPAVLVTPQGFRVEGLGLADLVSLLRGLR